MWAKASETAPLKAKSKLQGQRNAVLQQHCLGGETPPSCSPRQSPGGRAVLASGTVNSKTHRTNDVVGLTQWKYIPWINQSLFSSLSDTWKSMSQPFFSSPLLACLTFKTNENKYLKGIRISYFQGMVLCFSVFEVPSHVIVSKLSPTVQTLETYPEKILICARTQVLQSYRIS